MPRSQRLRRRRFAPITRTDRHPRLSRRLSFSPSGWSGECIAASAARRSGDPATVPHSGTRARSHCLPLAAALRPAPAARRLRRAALPHQCPARFIGSLAGCTFPIPPFRFCSLCSARCLRNRLAQSEFPPWLTRQDRSWTPFRRFPPILSSSLCAHRALSRRPPTRVVPGQAGSFNYERNSTELDDLACLIEDKDECLYARELDPENAPPPAAAAAAGRRATPRAPLRGGSPSR